MQIQEIITTISKQYFPTMRRKLTKIKPLYFPHLYPAASVGNTLLHLYFKANIPITKQALFSDIYAIVQEYRRATGLNIISEPFDSNHELQSLSLYFKDIGPDEQIKTYIEPASPSLRPVAYVLPLNHALTTIVEQTYEQYVSRLVRKDKLSLF